MDIELPFDFKEFLKLLNENGVRYLLIGGSAVGYHAYPRATNDMDVWIAIHPDNAQRVVNTLKDFGFDHPGCFLPRTNQTGSSPLPLTLITPRDSQLKSSLIKL